jgi:hypothetical protein
LKFIAVIFQPVLWRLFLSKSASVREVFRLIFIAYFGRVAVAPCAKDMKRGEAVKKGQRTRKSPVPLALLDFCFSNAAAYAGQTFNLNAAWATLTYFSLQSYSSFFFASSSLFFFPSTSTPHNKRHAFYTVTLNDKRRVTNSLPFAQLCLFMTDI